MAKPCFCAETALIKPEGYGLRLLVNCEILHKNLNLFEIFVTDKMSVIRYNVLKTLKLKPTAVAENLEPGQTSGDKLFICVLIVF